LGSGQGLEEGENPLNSDIEVLNALLTYCEIKPSPVIDITTNAWEYTENKMLDITKFVRATYSNIRARHIINCYASNSNRRLPEESLK
jgi:hypothetical protein